MGEQLRWEEADDGSSAAYDGSHLVGTITYGDRCRVRSGTHVSPETARAELEGWHRWRSTVDGTIAPPGAGTGGPS